MCDDLTLATYRSDNSANRKLQLFSPLGMCLIVVHNYITGEVC